MSVISHNFLVFDKQGFNSCLDKLTKRYKVEFNVKWGNSVDDVAISDGEHFPITRYHVTVEFSFEEFIIKGYTYLGCIKDESRMGFITIHGNDLTKDMDLSKFVNSFDGIPCHNCNRKHSRKIGHVFQVDESGELIVFGSSCAKNFFGINFTRLLNFFEKVVVGIDEWDEDRIHNYGKNYVDFETVMKLCHTFINTYGYVSVSKSKENDIISTSDDVKMALTFRLENLTKSMKDHFENLNIDFDIVGTKDFVNTNKSLSDFEHNILVVQEKIKNRCVTVGDIGLLSYMVFKTFFFKEKSKVEYVLPEWEKGHKLVKVPVVYDGVHSFEGHYGTTNIYTFITEDNIRLKWFTSIYLEDKLDTEDIEKGDKFVLSASVKSLESNDKYGDSVIITRARVK